MMIVAEEENAVGRACSIFFEFCTAKAPAQTYHWQRHHGAERIWKMAVQLLWKWQIS